MNDKQLIQFQTAKDQLKNQKYSNATDTLLNLYDEVDDNQVVLLLGEALVKDAKFVSAGRLVDDNLLTFLQEGFSLLTEIYLKNHRYLQLRIIANGQNETNKLELIKKIKRSETEYELNEPTTIESKSREFMHLGAFSSSRQKLVALEAETLPLNQYLTGVRLNLVDQDVNPVWRIQLLNNLMRLGFAKPVDFIWIDNTQHQIIPKNITDIEQTKAFKIIENEIKERVGQTNPILATQLQSVVNVDLQLLFPFVDKIVTNPKTWLTMIKARLVGDQSNDNCDQDVLKWLKLIDSIMKNLIN